MRHRRTPLAALPLLLLSACEQKNPYDKKAQPKPAGPPPKIVGIQPEKFDCQAFLSPQEVAGVAGGAVELTDTGVPPAEGTPRPCTYILPYKMTEEEKKALEKEQERRAKKLEQGNVSIEETVAAWGKERDKVFAVSLDCRKTSHERTQSWMASLAGQQGVKQVSLGRSAVDHFGGQLVFIDDKTPCSVTVSAPDERSRLALAQLVHRKLTPENAPMTPRAVQ